jgi:undecaprenyl-diphosphatase
MNWWEAVTYGLIQGLSEFLPVSSSGHLALLPHVMKIQDPGVVFDLMMHLGTALAVMTYFRREIISYARSIGPSLASFKTGSPQEWFVRNFITSTFTSVILIVTLIPLAKLARDPYVIMGNLIIFGALLWYADYRNKSLVQELDSPMQTSMQWRLAIVIGAAQALAIFPGVSRSGITLSAALFLGMKRSEASAYSFLMSLPIILAGIFKELPELAGAESEKVDILLIGIASSFVVGLATIHFFMSLIGKIQLKYFAFYRWIIAALMFFHLA